MSAKSRRRRRWIRQRRQLQAFNKSERLLVKAALGLLETGPPACPRVFSGSHGPRARLAAYRREVPVVQRVVGDIVFSDVVPDIFCSQFDERVYLHEAE